MDTQKRRVVTTRSVGVVAALRVAGFQPFDVDRTDGDTTFHFDRTPELSKAVDGYFADRLELPARRLLDEYHRVKKEYFPR